ncbi:hypothetical protein IE81DRAFT_16001 [Ceraceosorus guamensis]|uniref:Fatty acid desaturase domain-containing protein n=1 Tax=Ceraceosorus guamensis TaxID=1522189 RepID=A0A316VT68_9BASI|nr:hypothetical protein IE81DRAFT_16001 [Ceraceosorus guamensis]PWN39603.1 hypothetical protein IE81DRAFT_16001 [Ceraceosorus guamensis]
MTSKVSSGSMDYSHRPHKPHPRDEDLYEYVLPDLTIKQVLDAIPAHCKTVSTYEGIKMWIRDWLMAYAAYRAFVFLDAALASTSASSLPTKVLAGTLLLSVRIFYALLQGTIGSGIWFVAHEAGHRTLTTSKTINEICGFINHSSMLIPYWAWRIVHANHHANTGHIHKDENYIPRTRQEKGLKPLRPAPVDEFSPPLTPTSADRASLSEDEHDGSSSHSSSVTAAEDIQIHHAIKEPSLGEWLAEYAEDAPIFNFVNIFIMEVFGMPLSLIINFGGQRKYPYGTSYFLPSSQLFKEKHRHLIILSNLGVAGMLAILANWIRISGWSHVWWAYFMPFLVTNFIVVMLTYLQHIDPEVPHLSEEVWTFSRGALCTVDQSFCGPIGDWFTHNLSRYHVVHHLCSTKIPAHHLAEATEAVIPLLGRHYRFRPEKNQLKTLWQNVAACKTIANKTDPVIFNLDANGHARAFHAKSKAD